MPTRPTKTFTTRRSTNRSTNRPIDSSGNYALLTWDVTLQAYIFRFAYDENFLTMFKQYVLTQNRVPVYANGKFSYWVIAESVFDALRAICEAKWPSRVKVESRNDVERKLRDAEARFAQTRSVSFVQQPFNEFMCLCRDVGVVGPQTHTEELTSSFEKLTSSFDDLKKFYREAATKLHPDKGGDSSKMARLNYVWKELQKQLKP